MNRNTLIILLFLFITSCRNDLLIDETYLNNGETFDVESIKNSFNEKKINLSNGGKLKNIVPLWDKSFQHKNNLYIPIRVKNAFINIGDNKNVPYEQLNFLYIDINKENIEFNTMRIQPDEWIKTGDRLKVNGKISLYNPDTKQKQSFFSNSNGKRLDKMASTGGGENGVECMDVIVFEPYTDYLDIKCYGEGAAGTHTVDDHCSCTGQPDSCHPPIRLFRT